MGITSTIIRKGRWYSLGPAQEYVQAKMIEVAKERMYNPSKSVSEMAYGLGFKYPQHFSRFFKQRVAMSPGEFREVN